MPIWVEIWSGCLSELRAIAAKKGPGWDIIPTIIVNSLGFWLIDSGSLSIVVFYGSMRGILLVGRNYR